MNEEEFGPEPPDTDAIELPVIDHYAAVKRAATIVGDLRKALREEGFTREETFELVQAYWVSEMGVI
ncbi:DUF7187 family protein [Streptomyces sp. NPDC054849]